MCILFFQLNSPEKNPQSPFLFVFAGNRDEFYDRPTKRAHVWNIPNAKSELKILAGRDLVAGGTWLGISFMRVEGNDTLKLRGCKFAALTNFREPKEVLAINTNGRNYSRGHVVIDSLHDLYESQREISSGESYLERLKDDLFPGFNLVLADLSLKDYDTSLNYAYTTNRYPGVSNVSKFSFKSADLVRDVTYGLSNGILHWDNADVKGKEWPKVTKGKLKFQRILEVYENRNDVTGEELKSLALLLVSDLLTNDERCDKNDLPHTGVPKELEEKLSSIFVKPFPMSTITSDSGARIYGTRSSCVLIVLRDGRGVFLERDHTTPTVNDDVLVSFDVL